MGKRKTKPGDKGFADILMVVRKTKSRSIMDIQDACSFGSPKVKQFGLSGPAGRVSEMY
jgi:hypothetical protein